METDNNMRTPPYVSIILPCYGVEKYLERCMDSIVNQSLSNIEIILVDDGSPDKVPDMCDEWAKKDSRVKVVHKKNEGLGYARNSGLKVATGEYVAFVDSDDFVSRTMFEILYSTAKEYLAQAVYCGFHTVDSNGNVKSTRIETDKVLQISGKSSCKEVCLEMIGSPSKREECKYSMSVWHSIFKRTFLQEHNIFFCSERDFISEDMIFDVDFWGIADNVIFIPEAHYYYCFNETSLSRKFNADRYSRTIIHYNELVRRLRAKEYPAMAVDCAHKYLIWASRNIINNTMSSDLSFRLKYSIVRNICNDKKTWEKVKLSMVKRYLKGLPQLYYWGLTHNYTIVLMLVSLCANFKNSLLSK